MNHQKPTYKKVRGPDDQWEVFIYFWDQRDGADFSGWWFGSSAGGSQVWSRNGKSAPTPPRKGWAIPWSDKPREGFEVVMELQQHRPGEERATMGTAALR